MHVICGLVKCPLSVSLVFILQIKLSNRKCNELIRDGGRAVPSERARILFKHTSLREMYTMAHSTRQAGRKAKLYHPTEYDGCLGVVERIVTRRRLLLPDQLYLCSNCFGWWSTRALYCSLLASLSRQCYIECHVCVPPLPFQRW